MGFPLMNNSSETDTERFSEEYYVQLETENEFSRIDLTLGHDQVNGIHSQSQTNLESENITIVDI
jgi:hypothetical protein